MVWVILVVSSVVMLYAVLNLTLYTIVDSNVPGSIQVNTHGIAIYIVMHHIHTSPFEL